MKNMERKRKEQIKGRTNKRRLIFNPTIQLVVVNLYTKYEHGDHPSNGLAVE